MFTASESKDGWVNRARDTTRDKIRVFMMDLWSIVPYYDAYLTRALQKNGVTVEMAAITYYLDNQCFSQRDVRNRPGIMDWVGTLNPPASVRRFLKFGESMLNMAYWRWRFRQGPPDVVHVQFLPLLVWRLPVELPFLRFCKGLDVKIVYTVHDLLPHDSGDRYRELFQQVYRMMDGLVCHSEAIRQRLISEFGIAPEKTFVIPHGPFFYECSSPANSRVRELYGVVGDEPLVLWQGIIHPYKGIEFLLTSWARMKKNGTNGRLVIAGTGATEELESLRNRAKSLGISDSVFFDFRFLPLGDLSELYGAADIVVYPYKAVTTSGALLTGIALGKAIIATRLPVFQELLTNDLNAMLVEYGDEDQLARTLERLIDDREKRASLSAEVLKLGSGDEQWAMIAERTKNMYSTVLRRPQV